MKKMNREQTRPAGMRLLFAALLSGVALIIGGCGDGGGEREADDGVLINTIVLPTDVVLNLACENVGVWPENCVLDDPENPFANTPITEFDVNNPNDPFNKLELASRIPEGPSGAKARFYLWATALARRGNGENQYFTALALHELFDANSNVINQDEIVREQAKKAYRSVLENFFGGVAVRTCRVVDGCNPPSNFFIQLNEKVADNLYRTDATGYRRLVPGDPRFAIEVLIDWGFTYDPCTDLPACTNGVVSVGSF